MDVIVVMVFFSLALVIAGLIFFFNRLRGGDFDHGERLSLLPLADDDGATNETKQVDPRNRDDKLDRLGSNDSDELRTPPPA